MNKEQLECFRQEAISQYETNLAREKFKQQQEKQNMINKIVMQSEIQRIGYNLRRAGF